MAGFQVMPRLSADEFAALEADIVENGVRVPITVAEDGRIVDGHHRDEIARRHGLHCPRVTASGDDGVLRGLAFSLNVNRRHLSREQKRALIAESLRADPILRDNDHAKRVGASPHTVKSVRESEGIPTPDEVIAAEIEASGDNDYQIGQRLGVSQNTVAKVRDDFQNLQNAKNENPGNPAPEPEPEPPSWEPAGQLHPADLAALNDEKKSIFLPKPTPEPRPEAPSVEDLTRETAEATNGPVNPPEGLRPAARALRDMDGIEHVHAAITHVEKAINVYISIGAPNNAGELIEDLIEKSNTLMQAASGKSLDTALSEIFGGNNE